MSHPVLERYANLDTFRFRGQNLAVRFTGAMAVAEGVVCDTYVFEDDDSRDLGIIKVEANHSTPLQRILGGEYTIEGHVAGCGKLLVARGGVCPPDEHLVYEHQGSRFDRKVDTGDVMHWVSASDYPLVAFEICAPPYEDGRFENLN